MLGDLIVSVKQKPMTYKISRGMWDLTPYMYYLTPQVAKETQNEINKFLVFMLQSITGENDLTWSLFDALSMLLVTGNVILSVSKTFKFVGHTPS